MTEKEVYTEQSVTDQLEWIWRILELIASSVYIQTIIYIFRNIGCIMDLYEVQFNYLTISLTILSASITH